MLKRVSIQNFKSLKDVTLDLQKVNLLIGPNNSGKTNFLKALEFFVSLGFDLSKVEDFKQMSFKHQALDLSSEFEFEIGSQDFAASRNDDSPRSTYHFSQKYLAARDGYNSQIVSKIDDWFSLGGKRFADKPEPGYMKDFFNFVQTKVFRPDPTKLIHETKLSGNSFTLAYDGSNLINFYFSIFNNYEEISNRIQADLSRCIPEIARFRTPAVGGDSMLGLKFFDKQEVGFWASEVSEGVLYFLMLLCIINQPDPPKLLLLEEPEKGIHPRRIREVMDFIFRLAEEKDVQIILTTHNEHVLDDFSTRPESVFVFDKDEQGATYVRNLQRDIIEPTNARNKELGLDDIDLTTNLSENWLYGLLGGVPSVL